MERDLERRDRILSNDACSHELQGRRQKSRWVKASGRFIVGAAAQHLGSGAIFGKSFRTSGGGGISKKILLKTSPVAKQKIRRPLVNDVLREQVERGLDITEAFGVNQPVLPFRSGALGLMEKAAEILARCLSISRLVSAADHDVHTDPSSLADMIAP